MDADAPIQRHVTKTAMEIFTPRIVAMRTGGRSIQAIADEVGIDVNTVSGLLRRLGVPAPPRTIPHGTPSGWSWHKCDCAVCVEAKRAYRRAEHQRRKARQRVTADHGTQLAYAQGCECTVCVGGARVRSAERQARTVPSAYRHGRRWTALDAETAMRTDLTIEQRARLLGRTHAAVDDWLRAYMRRPDDPYGVKPQK